MSRYAFLADIGSTFTKGSVIDLGSGGIVCSGQVPTVHGGDVSEGFEELKGRLTSRSDSGSFEVSLASSSAGGGLRVVALGLMPELTAKAAALACLNAGGRLLGCYSHRIGEGTLLEIKKKNPDIILLAGGTDGGDAQCVLHNARKLSFLKGPAILYAGNCEAADEIRSLLRGAEIFFADNVLPEVNVLNIEPARERIRDIFLSRIISARGLERVAGSLDGGIVPTPSAVLAAVSLISVNLSSSGGSAECMAVDVGGATTDVYSAGLGEPSAVNTVLKGIPEPYLKRTVEADTGIRASMEWFALPEEHSAAPGRGGAMREWIDRVTADPSLIPAKEEEFLCDALLAARAAATAVERHCGRLKEHYSTSGRFLVQEGKDLRGTEKIFATGGAFSRNRFAPVEFSKALKRSGKDVLAPESACVIPDRGYIMCAAGLLASYSSEAAVRAVKESWGLNGT